VAVLRGPDDGDRPVPVELVRIGLAVEELAGELVAAVEAGEVERGPPVVALEGDVRVEGEEVEKRLGVALLGGDDEGRRAGGIADVDGHAVLAELLDDGGAALEGGPVDCADWGGGGSEGGMR
jgi:hypothetical protein